MPMTKGFPRPRKYIKKIRPRLERNKTIFSYDAKWDNKEYPMPYTGRVNQVGYLAYGRVAECVKNRLCIVCGEKVEDPWAYIYENFFTDDSGPFHEKCVTITQKLCPFVNENPDIFRFVKVDWHELKKGRVPDRLILDKGSVVT